MTAALQAHTVARQALDGRVMYAASSVLRSDVDWFNLSESWDATSEVAGIVNSGVRQEAALAQSFQNQVYSEAGIRATEPALSINGSLRTGTTPDLSYRRVGSDMRRHLNEGAPFDVALELVQQRLQEMVADDLALAMREQSRRFFMANHRTTLGYRRVVRPELSTTGTCGLCLVASDRKYGRADLLPIHTRCRCDVMAITPDFDPGDLNDVDLAALYEAAGSNRAGDLLNVKAQTTEHGELGPRIVPAGNPGSADYKGYLRTRIPPQEQSWQERLSNNDRRAQEIEARIAAGVELSSDRSELQQAREQSEDARRRLRDLYYSRDQVRALRAA